MSRQTILSLFDYTGNWSEPYRLAGYDVKIIDVKRGTDIMTWYYKRIKKNSVIGILAAPPCTHFTKASSLNWESYDKEGLTQYSVNLVIKILEIVLYFNPQFWAIENPPGRLTKLLPRLSKYRLLNFSPSEYGDPIYKYTILYGVFNSFLIKSYVKPIYQLQRKKGCKSLNDYYKKEFPDLNRSERRSITPPGFSQKFFEANNPLNK